MPLRVGGSTFLSFQYSGLSGRDRADDGGGDAVAAFLGWVGAGVMPQMVLNSALLGHPDTAVILQLPRRVSNVTFKSGKSPAGAESATISLHNGWTVTTFGAVSPRAEYSKMATRLRSWPPG